MKTLLLTVLATLTLTLTACQAEEEAHGQWLTDYEKALAQAKKEKKMVLLDFTGSDWCPPCKALHKNVFATKPFVDYANENLILVELDYPRAKPQSDEVKLQNKELARQYKIDGYPTVIVIDAEGKELFKEVGYLGANAKKYVARLKELQ